MENAIFNLMKTRKWEGKGTFREGVCDLLLWWADAAVSAIQVWGEIDQKAMEWLSPFLPELTSLAKKNPHFLPILKRLTVQLRNADTQKKLPQGEEERPS